MDGAPVHRVEEHAHLRLRPFVGQRGNGGDTVAVQGAQTRGRVADVAWVDQLFRRARHSTLERGGKEQDGRAWRSPSMVHGCKGPCSTPEGPTQPPSRARTAGPRVPKTPQTAALFTWAAEALIGRLGRAKKGFRASETALYTPMRVGWLAGERARRQARPPATHRTDTASDA